jgi:hypothetical protein
MNRPHTLQSYYLVWLDSNVSPSNRDSQHTLEHLRSTVNDVIVFTEPEDCLFFLQGIEQEKVYLIASGSLGQRVVPRIHAMTQIDAI